MILLGEDDRSPHHNHVLRSSEKPVELYSARVNSPFSEECGISLMNAARLFMRRAQYIAGVNSLFRADAGKSPLAAEAMPRIDPIFAIERDINGFSAEQRALPRVKRALRRSFIC